MKIEPENAVAYGCLLGCLIMILGLIGTAALFWLLIIKKLWEVLS